MTWAHPEFGQVLATCSFDRTASIWEETVGEKLSPAITPVKKWIRRTNLVDSRTSVTDVKFGPKKLGLLLATTSADGMLRIYEAPDIMNLAQWNLQHEIPFKTPLSCISWNHSMCRLHYPMIAVGSDDPSHTNGGKVFIVEYSENARRWTISDTINNITDPVHDIAFAPNMGRSYHILAVASKYVHILNLKPIIDITTGMSRQDIQNVDTFRDHYCTVWRVAWNITGTVLASTGDDGCVRMWKMNCTKVWKCAAIVKPDGSQPSTENVIQSSNNPNIKSSTTNYFKKGTISHPSQVPWH